MLYQLSYLAPAGECSRVDQPSRGGGRRDLRPGRVASAAVTATPRTVTIVGAPLDLGQGRRGVDMGPSAIRYADLEERLTSFGCVVVDRGNVIVPEPEALALRDERIRFLPEILEACAKLAEGCGAHVVGCAFVIELTFLPGRERLKPYDVFSLVQYHDET